ncbi:MAG: bifunctional phosphoribosylaminoimidazolecarboxamide formyltransferase/IMP cyclohydrolase, partial [Actinomycetota bacterium]|nr:bifunctional phosphoribosylaminoimidazolecarboxamide formyltransferase/IMP cyclohydrolase [Actinomycetota bacterium]
ECLDGRVKTLHPRVHAGLLADATNPEHLRQLEELGVEAFDLVVANLYPFTEAVLSGAGEDECVEQIDIGGPSMVRAAAKNHGSVAVVTAPTAYQDIVRAAGQGGFTLVERQRLAALAFAHTATYDVHVASWMQRFAPPDAEDITMDDGTAFPAWLGATWQRQQVLRYGENPHQRAALYRNGSQPEPGLAQGSQLHGKEMSYNNYIDADAARRAAHDQGDRPTVAIVKHANPCGIAVGADIAQAHRRAHACDPVSAYGGIVATNRPVTEQMARQVAEMFTEVVVAPGFEPAALGVLTGKKNLRILQVASPSAGGVETRPVSGGLLVQSVDAIDTEGDDQATWRLAAGDPADEPVLADLVLAWRAVRAVKSNAILLARDGASVGIGMGQVNRVDSCRLAVQRAGAERAVGAVAASDAFFPFADGLQILIEAGVRAVVSPGGSIRDDVVVAAAAAAGLTWYFTGTRHFAH